MAAPGIMAMNTVAGANAARDEIVLEHLSLVKAIAIRVHENLPVHVDLDDLIHAGVLGLFDAATKYDPDKKVVFQSYAKHRIKGAILTRDLTAQLGRAPTETEIAENMGVTLDRWRRMALELNNLGQVSVSSLRSDPDNNAPVEFPAAPDTQPDRICARQELRAALAGAMKDLPMRYQKVVFLYYTNEMTMKEIGEVLGVNESRVSQIHKVALEKMATSLRSVGIESTSAF
jgi:RNA polymerase sigma factor for flagellar operon FliA